MKRNQQGFVVASALILMLSTSLMIYFSFISALSIKEAGMDAEKRLEWVRDAQQKIDYWYGLNKAVIDSQVGPVSESSVLDGAGITLKYGAQFASSNRLSSSGIEYHNIVFWIPVDGASGTGLNLSTGEFNPGTLSGGAIAPTDFAMVHGLDVQTQAYLDSVAVARQVASKFELYFRAKIAADPDGDEGINYYRAAYCPTPVGGELPCVDTATDILSSGMQGAVGLLSSDVVDAWGQSVQVTNLAGIPPGDSAILISTSTPWGTQIKVFGVRP